jgi:hypothetical protein
VRWPRIIGRSQSSISGFGRQSGQSNNGSPCSGLARCPSNGRGLKRCNDATAENFAGVLPIERRPRRSPSPFAGQVTINRPIR